MYRFQNRGEISWEGNIASFQSTYPEVKPMEVLKMLDKLIDDETIMGCTVIEAKENSLTVKVNVWFTHIHSWDQTTIAVE